MMRLPAAKAKGVSGWKGNCLIKGKGRGINTRGNDRLVLWSCLPLPGGTTALCPTCHLLCRTDCPAASAAWWLLPLFHPAVPCLLIDWLVVHSSNHLLPSVPIHRLSCWHIHYFQSPPPPSLFSWDVSLALVRPGWLNPDSALTRQPHFMSLLTSHAPPYILCGWGWVGRHQSPPWVPTGAGGLAGPGQGRAGLFSPHVHVEVKPIPTAHPASSFWLWYSYKEKPTSLGLHQLRWPLLWDSGATFAPESQFNKALDI